MIYTQKELRDKRVPLLRRLERKSMAEYEKKLTKEEKVKKDKKEKKNFTKTSLFTQRWLLR